MIYLETQRTFMRQLDKNDAADFFMLNADPEVMLYTGDLPFSSITQAESFLSSYDPYQKYNVGRLAVILKSTGEFIGWCGLKYTEESNEYDIGFRFFKNHWNRGFATETAKACLKYGFETLNIKEIIGRAQEENHASIRVLEKLGLKYIGKRLCGESEGVIFSMTKRDWEAISPA